MSALVASAAAAPPAAVAGLTAGLFLVLFLWAVLWGLQRGYYYTLGALLREITDFLGGNIPLIGGTLARPFRAIDNLIMDAMGAALETTDRTVAQLWAALSWVVRETYNALSELAADTYESISGVITREIPEQTEARVKPTRKSLNALRNVTVPRIWQAVAAGVLVGAATARELDERFGRARRGIDAIKRGEIPRVAGAAAAGIAIGAAANVLVGRRVVPSIDALKRWLARGAVGAIALSLIFRVAPGLRCTNVRNFHKALCRLPVGLLAGLLGVVGAAITLTDLCRIARMAEGFARVVAPVLLGTVVVVDAAVNCTSFPKPPGIPLQAAALPQSEALVTL